MIDDLKIFVTNWLNGTSHHLELTVCTRNVEMCCSSTCRSGISRSVTYICVCAACSVYLVSKADFSRPTMENLLLLFITQSLWWCKERTGTLTDFQLSSVFTTTRIKSSSSGATASVHQSMLFSSSQLHTSLNAYMEKTENVETEDSSLNETWWNFKNLHNVLLNNI